MTQADTLENKCSRVKDQAQLDGSVRELKDKHLVLVDLEIFVVVETRDKLQIEQAQDVVNLDNSQG